MNQRSPFVALALAFAAGGCDDAEPRRVEHEIAEAREVAPGELKLDATSAERLRDPRAAGSLSDMAEYLDYVLPAGWSEAPATQFRDLNFVVGEGGEAYLTRLPGGGGGAKLNVERWRREFGLPPLADAELAALPRAPLFGLPAVVCEAEGTMTAMGQASREGFAMVGLFAELPEGAISLKLTGPRALVAVEKDKFLLFARSLTVKAESAPRASNSRDTNEPSASEPALPAKPPAEPPVAAAEEPAKAPAFRPDALRWIVPSGWKEVAGSAMRTVTLEAAGGSQCWVTVLGGQAGGLEANVNRWRGEVGQAPLSADEVARLPRLKILGVESPVLDLEGKYAGMGGPAGLEKARVFAVPVLVEGALVSIKMVGPPDAMAGAKSAFEDFCRSLEVRP